MTAPGGLQTRPCEKLTRHAPHRYPITAYRQGGTDSAGRVVPVPITVTVYCPGQGRQ